VRVGSLQIEILAGIARLQKDMNDAQRIVGSSMGQVERSVASANRAMQALGLGIPVAMITDQVRRMTDQYTKLDAQLRLATKSQAQYAQGMSDIRRISTVAQSDIGATSMLYTRLINVMDGTGVSQAKLATVTETVAYGLKAYGATAAEASSASLQLSQAMGANRLGGEEFRAVMEAMPNVMKVLAKSMGVPLGELRALSIAGKITADEMVKAFGDPAIAAEFKRMALSAQTITGAWTVARNELMLLVGEFMKSSGATGAIIAGFNSVGVVLQLLVDNIHAIIIAVQTYAAIMAGKFLYSLIDARLAQIALNAAHAEALAMNVAMAQAEVRRLTMNMEVITSERAKTVVVLQSAQATMAATAAMGAHSMALRANAVATSQAAIATAELAALGRAQAATAAAQTAATEALAAAQITTTGSFKGKIAGLVGRAGIWGLIMFGIYEIADAMGWIDKLFDNAEQRTNKFANKQSANLDKAIADMEKQLAAKKANPSGMFGSAWEVSMGGSQVEMQAQLAMLKKMRAEKQAEYEAVVAADNAKRAGVSLSHDEEVMQGRMVELAAQYNDAKLTEAEYLKRVNEALYGRAKAGKAALTVAELQAKNDAEVLNASAEYWKKIDEKRLEDEQKAEQDALAKRQKEHEKFWESIDKTAHDTFVSILDGSKDVATRLRDMFKNIFFDWLYQMTIKKWIIGVSAAFAPTAASATSSMAGTGSMGAAGLGFGTAMGVAGSALSVGMGAGMGASAGYAGAALSSGSYASAIGFGAAAAAPVVAALIIAKYGFGLGNTRENVGAQRLVGTVGTGGVNAQMAQDWKIKGGWFTSDSTGTDYTAISKAMRNRIANDASTVQQVFVEYGKAVGDTSIALKYFNADVNDLANGIGNQLVPSLNDFRMEGETLVDTAKRMTQAIAQSNAFIKTLQDSAISQFQAAISAKEALKTTAQGIRDFIASIGVKTLLGAALSFSTINAQAVATGDASKLQSAANDYLTVAKTGAGTATDYARAIAYVQTEMGNTALALEGKATTTELQLTEMQVANQYLREISIGIANENIISGVTNQALADGIVTTTEATDIDRAIAASVALGVTTAAAGNDIQALIKAATSDGNVTATEAKDIQDAIKASTLAGTGGNATASAISQLERTLITLNRSIAVTQNTEALKAKVGVGFNSSLVNLDATGAATYQSDKYTSLTASGGQVSTTTNAALQAYDQALAVKESAKAALDKAMATPSRDASYYGDGGRGTMAAYQKQADVYNATVIPAQIAQVQAAYDAIIAQVQAAYDAIPQFAAGGVHSGGMRIVGENGPEIEYTGPSNITSNSDSRKLLDVSGVIASVDALRTELRSIGVAVSGSTQKTAKILDRWDGQGMPEVRIEA
jgi:tape measure domain-containing protein